MEGEKIEYRVWNPFRSKLAAAVLGGVESIYMPPGSKVLYLGAASGTTVSHVADVVGKVRDGVWKQIWGECGATSILSGFIYSSVSILPLSVANTNANLCRSRRDSSTLSSSQIGLDVT